MSSSPKSLGLVPAIFNPFLDDEFDSILLSAPMLSMCVASNNRGNRREQIEIPSISYRAGSDCANAIISPSRW